MQIIYSASLRPLFPQVLTFNKVDFDKDDEFFATAGVTKKIKIFDYASVVTDYKSITSSFITKTSYLGDSNEEQCPVARYPVREMSCHSKVRYQYLILVAFLGIRT